MAALAQDGTPRYEIGLDCEQDGMLHYLVAQGGILLVELQNRRSGVRVLPPLPDAEVVEQVDTPS